MFHPDIISFLEANQFVQQADSQQHWLHASSALSIILLSSKGMKQFELDAWESWLSKFPKAWQIWEEDVIQNLDLWQKQILARLHFTKSVFARDTRIVPISAEAARHFLDKNHVLGFSKGQTYLACVVPAHRQFRGITSEFEWEGCPLLAVAVFGKLMVMKEEGMEGLLSGELIKLVTLPDIRLVGGLTKFLQAYHEKEAVHHVMTYIDLGSSSGKGFLSAGFHVVNQTPPMFFKLNAGKRVLVSCFAEAEQYSPGNLKLRYVYEN